MAGQTRPYAMSLMPNQIYCLRMIWSEDNSLGLLFIRTYQQRTTMTKSITPAAVIFALAANVGTASAESSFELNRPQSSASTVALTNVEADQPGHVEVYSYDGKTLGSFLGRAPVTSGTNGNVNVSLDRPADGRLLILMTNGNYAVTKLDVRDALIN